MGIDLRTTYLGLELAHPLMPGASPLVDDLDVVKRLEDAGAAAITMHSVFEEQIVDHELGTLHYLETNLGASAEAVSYFPEPDEFCLGPAAYLEQIRKIKAAVRIPVIGSLNGRTAEGWLSYAKQIEQAGADALELNVYHVAADPDVPGAGIEARLMDVVKAVKRSGLKIPLAVKLSPYFSSVANLALQLEAAGVDGLVLFNRFYQPDFDVETLEVVPALRLSDSSELLLRLRWLAILSGRVRLSLAASGGVHTAVDALKAIMAGAHAVQVVSALLKHGPGHLTVMRADLERWLEEHEYASLRQAQGSMSLARSPDPAAFERGNYLRILQGWKP